METSLGHGDLGDSEIGSRISKVESRSRRPPAPICVKASVLPETQARQTACPGVPSLSDALADCARPRARGAIK
jgi:hypothetical protein